MSENKKLERDIESTSVSKLLVICVDRDDDVGKKAGITTPVVGRDSMYQCSTKTCFRRSRRCRFKFYILCCKNV